MDTPQFFKPILAVIGGIVAAILLPIAPVLGTLLGLMLLDLVAALIANGKAGKLDPTVGYLGWRRKAQTILIILALALLQRWGIANGLTEIPAAQVVSGGFCVVELLSVLKHAMRSGVRIPLFLQQVFANMEKDIIGSEPAAHKDT